MRRDAQLVPRERRQLGQGDGVRGARQVGGHGREGALGVRAVLHAPPGDGAAPRRPRVQVQRHGGGVHAHQVLVARLAGGWGRGGVSGWGIGLLGGFRPLVP